MTEDAAWFGDLEDMEETPLRIHNSDAETDAVLVEHQREAEHMREEPYVNQCRACGCEFTPRKDETPRDLCDDCFSKNQNQCEAMEDFNDFARDSIAPEHLTDYDYCNEDGR